MLSERTAASILALHTEFNLTEKDEVRYYPGNFYNSVFHSVMMKKYKRKVFIDLDLI